MKKKIVFSMAMMVLVLSLSACQKSNKETVQSNENASNGSAANNQAAMTTTDPSVAENNSVISNVNIQFGEDGDAYTIVMEHNDTARELVKNVTEAGRNLPIYDYDNFEGYEYFQYYDIPTTYDIPSEPESITEAKAGEVYYSAPNRVILFYQDAKVSGEYTKVGQIEDATGLKEAVEQNPVLEGWGNKLILVRYAE